LAPLGERLARRLSTDVDLLVRPHPLTGSADRSLRRALARLRRALAERGESGRYVDPAAENLATTLAEADVLITDVSSVLVDFLAADRPAIVADVAGVGADEIHSRYPTTAWAGILAPDLDNLEALLEEAFTTDGRRALRRTAAAELLGDVASPEAAFHSALRALVDPPSGQTGRDPVDS
jgi:CDP-glycerol glycerophosphotransferase (TagB/SpsB family)